MSVLTLVRHGQASYMSEDYDKLSPVGEEQARQLGRYWTRHGIAFDRVFHGPAQRHIRTMQMAGEMMQAAGLPWPEPELLAGFDEFDAFLVVTTLTPLLARNNETVRGLSQDFERSRHTPEAGRKLQKLFEEVTRHWTRGEIQAADVETWVQFRARIAVALDRLRTSARPSSHTVVFTSGGPIAATVSYALELPPAKAVEFVWLSRNSSYAQFLFSGERFSMHAFNAIPHLESLELLTYR